MTRFVAAGLRIELTIGAQGDQLSFEDLPARGLRELIDHDEVFGHVEFREADLAQVGQDFVGGGGRPAATMARHTLSPRRSSPMGMAARSIPKCRRPTPRCGQGRCCGRRG
jgi:hypothetical protein